MKKIKLIASLLALFALAVIFVFRNSIFSRFSPRIREVEKFAFNAAIQELKKEIATPPPLRVPTAAKSQKTPAMPAPQPILSIAGTINRTNAERASSSLPALVENTKLDAIAKLRLDDMFQKQYFAHVAPNGSNVESVAKTVGYDYIALGENLALGNFGSDKELVRAWMNSPGHRANILNPRYGEIGVAVKSGVFEGKITWLAAQIFGKPMSDCVEPDIPLKSQIDANDSQLQSLQNTLAALKTKIESDSNRGQYQSDVDEYNSLANQYNALLEQTKLLAGRYNSQASAFNLCVAS